MAFQGNFPAHTLSGIGVPETSFSPGGLEYYGQVSFLKAGVRFADQLTTVSPTYAREILTEEFGFGFEGLLRERASELSGILNGADYAIWDPSIDPFLSVNYDAGRLNGKKACKAALQRELGLTEAADVPLLAFVSRMTEQKMADVLLAILPQIADADMQLVVLSDGDHGLEEGFRQMAQRHPDKIAVRIGYEEPLAHRIQAGSDILLAPARFEPCGLSQIYAMRYGTVPIVRATGGLADTVTDTTRATISDGTASGFVFSEPTVEGLRGAIDRAAAFYREPLAWRRLQLSAMKQDFSWNRSAAEYLALYESLTSPAASEDPLEALLLAGDLVPEAELEQGAA
jgi:starch synthase